MKKVFTLIVFGFTVLFVVGQEKYFFDHQYAKYVLETNGHFGKIFKHTSAFEPDVTEMSYLFEAGFSVRNFGEKAWQQKLNYPEVGATYIYASFGDKDIFGQANGALAHVKFWFNRNRIADTYFKVGSGLAWLNSPYDFNINPTNNVIGSKLNNVTQFKLGADFHLYQRLDFTLAFAFTHFSNAKTQSPNLGINIPSLAVGLKYSPFVQNKVYIEDTIPPPKKKNEYSYRFSVGITNQVVGGAKFPVYTHTFHYARYTSIANKVWMGASWSTNMYEHDRLLFDDDTDNPKLRASDFSVFVGDEILVGKVGLHFLVGAYLLDKELRGAPIYAKLGVNYYCYEFAKNDHKLFFGLNLKTHYITAQYVELGGGIAF